MSRLLLGVAAMLAGLSGCSSQSHYVSRASQTGTGVVAIPDNTDVWPNYNMRSAIAMIEKDVGPNYEIIEQCAVTTNRPTVRDQHSQTEHVRNPNQINPSPSIDLNPAAPSTHEVTEWRITYRKVDAPATGGGVQQTRYLSGAGLTGDYPGPGTSSRPATSIAPATSLTGVYPAGGIGGIVPSCAPGAGVVSAGGIPAGGCADGKCNLR